MRKFTGSSGRARLVSALRDQYITGGDTRISKALARKIKLRTFATSKNLIVQGEPEDDLFFILGGSVAILANGREVARRFAGDHVGEMCLLDTTARRSATVRALEPTFVAKMSEDDFTRIATNHPHLWRRVALTLSHRLRERNKFQIPPRTEPAIFIGSSSEGIKIANCIYSSLRRNSVVPRLWSQGVFECTKTTIEDLLRIANETDFAIIVLTNDDVTRSRGRSNPTPRDNVIFELGLFMGALSRDRTYIIAKKGIDLKLPTDLLGVKLLNFKERAGKSLAFSLRLVVRELRTLITRHGPL